MAEKGTDSLWVVEGMTVVVVMAVVVELEAGIVGVGEVGEVDVVLMAVMVEIGVVVEVGGW